MEQKKFETKKEEFIYYATKALAAEQAGDQAAYLMNLKIAKDLMEEIEGKTAEEIHEEEQLRR